ncbi:uncharacterized protein LOC133825871 [Humulus lupulus]|uniref:uncharacterized protein LOC133825871 n=1 Tax=Humulus lupulus TaxID=3486 RepID=UPI002B40405C|nr:uncharacterized protein LOC133825871 [Humulus lupulus]
MELYGNFKGGECEAFGLPKTHKVLFAEVGKDFVDFLFHILSLPIATVIKLLTKNGMVGCLGNLYSSIEKLDETYIQPNQNKGKVLNPKHPASSGAQLPLLLSDTEAVASNKIYMCPGYHRNASHDPLAVCPQCDKYMNVEINCIVPDLCEEVSSGGGGFVKGLVTYMVMDNLVVEPMSTISGITLLSKFNVKEVGALEERVVNITMAEGLKLLQASLQCSTVLTTVFVGKAGASA